MPRRLGLILNRKQRSIVELWTSNTALSSKAFKRTFVCASCRWATGGRRPKAEVRGRSRRGYPSHCHGLRVARKKRQIGQEVDMSVINRKTEWFVEGRTEGLRDFYGGAV